jgi:hypothetical protein
MRISSNFSDAQQHALLWVTLSIRRNIPKEHSVIEAINKRNWYSRVTKATLGPNIQQILMFTFALGWTAV